MGQRSLFSNRVWDKRKLTGETMAFLYNIVYDRYTGRHCIEFVNQQFDYLMGIAFDDSAGDYTLNVSLEEAQKICREWGKRDFDLAYWLKIARQELPAYDNKFPIGP